MKVRELGEILIGRKIMRKQWNVIIILFITILFLFSNCIVKTVQSQTTDTKFYYPINIDYERPEIYLNPGKQSQLKEKYLVEIQNQINSSGDSMDEVEKIYHWININFKASAGGGASVGRTTANSIYKSKHVTGCHDSGLILSTILRYYGFPAIMVDTAGIQWAKGGVNGFSGHVFVEVYVQGKWILLDSNSREYIENYNYLEPVIPIKKSVENQGFYVLYKGIDPAGYGVRGIDTLKSRMTRFAFALPKIDLYFPNYEIKRF